MSDDDSSLELFDIDPQQVDFFDYEDPLATSPQFSAVLEDNVSRLSSLLKDGLSVNINDNTGKTPLHMAVQKNKREVFDFMLTVEDIRLDVVDFSEVTPLMLAVMEGNDYCALELIKKGADVNLCNNSRDSPLHCAYWSLEVAQALIAKGAAVNDQNVDKETPLHIACKENSDFAHLLLCNGADPLITNADGFLPFTISLSKAPDLQETLFYHTFHDDSRMSLQTIFEAMQVKSSYFPKLITRTILYSPADFRYLNRVFFMADPEMLSIFMKKFEPIVREFLAKFNVFFSLFANCNRQTMDAFFKLCDTPIMDDIVEYSHKTFVLGLDYFLPKVTEEMLHEILLVLLSYGFCLYKLYVDIIYERFGFGKLFKTLVHMDLQCPMYRTDLGGRFLMSSLICDVSLDTDILYEMSDDSIPDFNILIQFFVHPKLSQYGERNFQRKLPKVPSLVELSRNRARKHIIEKYKTVNSRQFFTMLKWLPVPQIYKDILSYEKPIYC